MHLGSPAHSATRDASIALVSVLWIASDAILMKKMSYRASIGSMRKHVSKILGTIGIQVQNNPFISSVITDVFYAKTLRILIVIYVPQVLLDI